MDCSPPGSSVHGLSQARILEWVAISFSSFSSIIKIISFDSLKRGKYVTKFIGCE